MIGALKALSGGGMEPGPMLRSIVGARPPQERRALLDVLELVRSADELGPPELPAWARPPIAAAADAHGISRELLQAVAWCRSRYRPDWSHERADLSGHGIMAVPLMVLDGEGLRPENVVTSEPLEENDPAHVTVARCVHTGAAALAAARKRLGIVGALSGYCEASGSLRSSDCVERIAAATLVLAARRLPAGPLESIAADLEGA